MEYSFFRRLSNGRSAVVAKREVMEVVVNKTAKHEGDHIGAAKANGTEVLGASIIPGPGYLGVTYLSRFDSAAAAAPHARGHSGTGHDLAVIEHMGESVSAASAKARSLLAGREAQVRAIAAALEERGSLSGSEIDAIWARGPKIELVLLILSPEGKTERATPLNTIADAEFLLPNDLPKAA